MVERLVASKPDPSLRDEADVFGRFVGTWDCDYTHFAGDGSVSERYAGEVVFGWIMEGRAIQDVARLSGGWSMLFYMNPILNWVVPLVVLLPAGTKRHAPTLAPVATLVLLGRWLDCYLLVAPAAGPLPGFPTAAVAASVTVLGGMALLFRRILAREALDPTARDSSIG